jgi:hypothetical protein
LIIPFSASKIIVIIKPPTKAFLKATLAPAIHKKTKTNYYWQEKEISSKPLKAKIPPVVNPAMMTLSSSSFPLANFKAQSVPEKSPAHKAKLPRNIRKNRESFDL